MATVRIYRVAELLGTTSQEVLALLKRDHGIELKSASSTLEEVVARSFVLPEFDGNAWLSAPVKGLGGRSRPLKGARHLYAEVTASSEATLILSDARTGKRYEFDLGQATAGKELEARSAGARVEILEQEKVWLHGQVIDAGMKRARQ